MERLDKSEHIAEKIRLLAQQPCHLHPIIFVIHPGCYPPRKLSFSAMISLKLQSRLVSIFYYPKY